MVTDFYKPYKVTIMSELRIKERVLNVQYGYSNESLLVDGSYMENQEGGVLAQINGQCYAKKEDGSRGSNVGNFNGYRRGGVMKYTTSEMTPEYGIIIWEAIQDIVSHIDADGQE